MDMASKTQQQQQPPHINPIPVPRAVVANVSTNATNYDSNDSISSIDDECNANALLQQCIQDGIGKAKSLIQPTTPNFNVNVNAMKLPPNPVAAIRRSQLPTPRATTSSSHRSRSKIRHPYDGQPPIGGNEKPNKYNTHSHLMHGRNMDGWMPSNICDRNDQQQQQQHHHSSNGYSKNVSATSANVSRTAGAPDVVMTQTTGTDHCAPDQHQRDDVSAQTMTSTTNDQGGFASFCKLNDFYTQKSHKVLFTHT